MNWNWRPWAASAVAAIGTAFLITITDPAVTSWSHLVTFPFWQKVAILLVTHAGLAKTSWRSRDARTRADDNTPLTLNLFDRDKNGGKK